MALSQFLCSSFSSPRGEPCKISKQLTKGRKYWDVEGKPTPLFHLITEFQPSEILKREKSNTLLYEPRLTFHWLDQT